MRNFVVNQNLPTGHKAGEYVSELRLPAHDVPGWLKAGLITEVPGVEARASEPAPLPKSRGADGGR